MSILLNTYKFILWRAWRNLPALVFMKTGKDYAYTKWPKAEKFFYDCRNILSFWNFLRLHWFVTLYKIHMYNLLMYTLMCTYFHFCICACMLTHFSHVWLFVTLCLLGSSIHEISQARILEWVAMPSSRGSSQPKDRTCVSYVSCIGRWDLYH